MRMWWIGVVVLLVAVQAGAQTVFYWVGGSGTFADAAHWSASSGGGGGVGVPGSSDQARIDLLSGTGTMTLDPGLVGTHITLGTFHITPDSTITIDPGHSLVETTGYAISPGFWDGFGWWDVDGITPFYDVQIDARGADVVQIFDGGVMHTLTLMPGINVQFESYLSNSIPIVTADSVVCAGTGLNPITISQWSPGTVRWAVAQQVVCTSTTVDHNACISTVPCVGTTDAGNNTGWQFIGDTTPVPSTWTPTVTPTETPTTTPTATSPVGCGAISTNPSGLTCIDAAMETGSGTDCTTLPGSPAQGSQACCNVVASSQSYCTGDTGTTCSVDSDCAGGATGPCVIVTCTFTAGGACSPATFPEGAIGGACVAGATLTPTATGPTPTPTACDIGSVTLQYIGSNDPAVFDVDATGIPVTITHSYPVTGITSGDVLTSPSENGTTLDATAHSATRIGATLTIDIFGASVTKDILNTRRVGGCVWVNGDAAPLDVTSPNNSPPVLCRPSPDWQIVNFACATPSTEATRKHGFSGGAVINVQ